MSTLTTDPIMTAKEAQVVLDVNDEGELVRLINSVSAKARAFMGRVQLNESTSSAIVENIRGVAVETIYLHAPVNTSDFDTYEVKVELYCGGVVSQTLLASENEIIVTSDDFSARIDMVAGSFPEMTGGDFIRVTYFGGWDSIPGDVFAGAVMQARVELKRLSGEVGMSSHSANGQSVQVDQAGVITEAAALWQPYRMLV